MESFFFHKDEYVAPPPDGYVAMTIRRALWQNLGLRPDDLNVRDYFLYLRYLSEEMKASKKSDG